jgi:hypothetical protein
MAEMWKSFLFEHPEENVGWERSFSMPTNVKLIENTFCIATNGKSRNGSINKKVNQLIVL